MEVKLKTYITTVFILSIIIAGMGVYIYVGEERNSRLTAGLERAEARAGTLEAGIGYIAESFGVIGDGISESLGSVENIEASGERTDSALDRIENGINAFEAFYRLVESGDSDALLDWIGSGSSK